MIDVREFGTFTNGNHATLINTALASGHDILLPNSDFLPNMAYSIDTPLLMNNTGQTLRGGSPTRCKLVTPADLTSDLDMIRIASSHCVAENMFIWPGRSNHIGVRTYVGWTTLDRLRIFSAVNGQGKAVVLTTINPTTGQPISGAYNNLVKNSWLGYWGYGFQTAIEAYGQNANRYIENHILGDKFISATYGGGNLYAHNTMQSLTGTYTVPSGYAIDLAADAVGEMVIGNYFERYTAAIRSARTDNTYKVFGLTNNHYDNCGAHYSVLSGLENYNDDEEGAYSPPPPSSFNELTGGTVFGDMTSGAGINAPFTGSTSKAIGECATSAAYVLTGHVGKDWGTAKTVAKYEIWGSSNYGYDLTSGTGSTVTITAKLQGWNGSAWVDLHTIAAFQDNNTSQPKSIASGITQTACTKHRVQLTSANGGGVVLAAVKFYEAA